MQLLSSIKLNLFLDAFHVISKLIDTTIARKSLDYLKFLASCCRGGGKLNVIKLLLDELAYSNCSPVGGQISEQFRSIFALLLQDGYRQDNLDIAVSDYLTKTRGLSPAYEPSTYHIPATKLQPFIHVQCYESPYSPLHTAIFCGNVSAVRALMAPTGDLFHARHHLSLIHI